MNQEAAELRPQLGNPIRNFSVRLSPTPLGARLARLLTEEQLRTWGLPLENATQIVAELAANAATHGRVPGRDFRLTLYVVGSTLRIEVTDTCPDRLPRPAPADPASSRAAACSWWTRSRTGGASLRGRIHAKPPGRSCACRSDTSVEWR